MEFMVHFSEVTDPRQAKNQKYSFESLMLIAFSSIISGCESVEEINLFAKTKLDWLRKFVELPGVPCVETLRYFICAVNPNELSACFQSFAQQHNVKGQGDHLAIDGKTMRGSKNKDEGAIHLFSVWSRTHGITLSMLESEGKKNEIKTIPKILDSVDIEGATVSLDAMGCQKAIATKIIEKKGDYVLQLKGNQGSLLEQVEAFYHLQVRENFKGLGHEVFEEADKGHGRLELRTYTHFSITDWVEGAEKWTGLKSIIRACRVRESDDKRQEEVSWYISSPDIDAKKCSTVVRDHWSVENQLHWRLDVVFHEDKCAIHSAHGAKNMGIIKRYCMNLLSQDTTVKRMKHRLKVAAMDDSYRERVLFG